MLKPGVAVVVLLACVGLIVWVERRAAANAVAHDAHPEEPLSNEGAFQMLLRDRYLLLIAGMVIFLNGVNSSGEYLLDRTLVAAAEARRSAHGGVSQQVFIGAFKANYYAWYNAIGVALQLFFRFAHLRDNRHPARLVRHAHLRLHRLHDRGVSTGARGDARRQDRRKLDPVLTPRYDAQRASSW